MHTLLKISMTDFHASNAAVIDGRIQKIFEQTSKTINPDNVFFYSEQGYRTALFVFDLKDSSQIPQISEPFFTQLNAKVEFFPIMDITELNHGLEAWHKQVVGHDSLS